MNKIIQQTNRQKLVISQERGLEWEEWKEIGCPGLCVLCRHKSDLNWGRNNKCAQEGERSLWKWTGELLLLEMRKIERLWHTNKLSALLFLVLQTKGHKCYQEQRFSNTSTNYWMLSAVSYLFHWWKPGQRTRWVGFCSVLTPSLHHCTFSYALS